MRTTLKICLLLALPSVLLAQSDTTRVNPDDKLLNAFRYQDHALTATVTQTHRGVDSSTTTYAIASRIMTQNGRKVFRVVIDAIGTTSAQSLHSETILDARTTAPLHYDLRTGGGGMLKVGIDGAHIVGKRRASADSSEVPVDVWLSEPAFISAYEDAAINAIPLHRGMTIRVPVFAMSPTKIGKVQGLVYRVDRRESIQANGRRTPAWIVESVDGAHGTIWLIDDAPYTHRWIRPLADGGTSRLDQVLKTK